MTLGKKLKNLRTKTGLTQNQVAERLGIQRGRYNSWENDIAKPRFEMLEALCDVYNVQMNDLVEKKDETRGMPREKELDYRTRSLAQDFQELDNDEKELLENLIRSMRSKK
ncbi:helix-turn-helix domain-containing protein [Metabacillus idriensis]|uniref:helix-turn-helix domain-containing protein n=1 Tax=Metabacillus idriensis TaxID=324768 RepID=UPI00204233B0|nr:helix-turn-helix transcriptional regulator [Metabacillus idriensis]MCM3594178.1 helix-turn-helix domain-containing protein [Metabacillus idriensis]